MNRRSSPLTCSLRYCFVGAAVAFCSAPAGANDPTPEQADSAMADAPLTLVVRTGGAYPGPPGSPIEWTFSINSAGAAELTTEYVGTDRNKPVRHKFEIPAEKMAAIRKALREERFFHLAKVDGAVGLHARSTWLTVTAGPFTATQTFESPSWPGWKGDAAKAAAPAMRVFLAVCDAVDPEGKVFTELPKVKRAVQDLTK
jgi:hypothetical protein